MGKSNRGLVPHDTRDQIVGFVQRWSEKTETGAGRFIVWLDIAASKLYDWRERYDKVNEHNGWLPRDSGWKIGRSRPSSASECLLRGVVILPAALNVPVRGSYNPAWIRW